MLSKKIILASTIGMVCMASNIWGQQTAFNVRLNSDHIGINEYLLVTYVITNVTSKYDFNPPGFPGFEVMDGPQMSSSSNISIINGMQRASTTINYSYVLKPTKVGTFTLSPAKLQVNGGILQTPAIKITVANQNQSNNGRSPQKQQNREEDIFEEMDRMAAEMQRRQQQMMQQLMQQMEEANSPQTRGNPAEFLAKDLHKNIFIKVDVDKKEPYIGQQMNVTYKLYTRLQMNMKLSSLPTLKGFWSQELQLDPKALPVFERLNGKEYQVFTLKKTALFPQQQGKLMLDPARAGGTVQVTEEVGRQGRQIFYDSRILDIELNSEVIPINVKPLPTQNQPESFTGGVGKFNITAKINKDKITTDEVIQLTLTVDGSGNIKLIDAPKLNLPIGLQAVDPVVSDTITGRNPLIVGSKTFTYSIAPDKVGKFVIPALTFAYFDPESNSYKEITTDSFPIEVTQGSVQKAPISNAGATMNTIHPNVNQFENAPSPIGFIESIWFKLLLAFPILGLLFAIIWKKRANNINNNLSAYKLKQANKVAWKRLATARKHLAKNESAMFYEAISKAIWLYFSDKLSIPLKNLNKDNVAQELSAKGIDNQIVERVNDVITQCELALYSKSGSLQQMDKTLENATLLIGDFEKELKK